jgi:hypothetical protein
VLLLALGWLRIVEMGNRTLLEHALMMSAMLVPMLFRLDVYAGHVGHARTLTA